MATRRDLIDAQAYDRRRLRTALVSGGEEVEAPPVGRTLAGGLALAALLLAGVAILSRVGDPSDLDWLGMRLVAEDALARAVAAPADEVWRRIGDSNP